LPLPVGMTLRRDANASHLREAAHAPRTLWAGQPG
jgi:hypothetical protein